MPATAGDQARWRILKPCLRSHGAGSRPRPGYARPWSIRRIAARETIALQNRADLFVVLGQPPPAAEPSQRPFHHLACLIHDGIAVRLPGAALYKVYERLPRWEFLW
jgi:hypothetical protein